MACIVSSGSLSINAISQSSLADRLLLLRVGSDGDAKHARTENAGNMKYGKIV